MDKPLLCLLFFIFSVVPVYESVTVKAEGGWTDMGQ